MNNHQLILQDSGDTEYYTDPVYTGKARILMNGIGLDPASSARANVWIGAERIYTAEDDGLTMPWDCDTLWQNHPFARGEDPCPTDRSKCKKVTCVKRGHHIDKRIPSNSEWINRLVNSFDANVIRREAMCISFASTSEAWYRPLQQFAQLHLVPRCNYYLPNGKLKKGVTKGSAITFLTRDWYRIGEFEKLFGRYGEIRLPYRFYQVAINFH